MVNQIFVAIYIICLIVVCEKENGNVSTRNDQKKTKFWNNVIEYVTFTMAVAMVAFVA